MEASPRKKNKSFIKILKRMGPNIEPWGTPDIISLKELYEPFIRTDCFQVRTFQVRVNICESTFTKTICS